jgi:hypothetical protein
VGDTDGFISTDVEGPDGCKAGQDVVNCGACLPIVVDDPAETGNNRQMWCIGFAPFYITAPKPNGRWGNLMRDYIAEPGRRGVPAPSGIAAGEQDEHDHGRNENKRHEFHGRRSPPDRVTPPGAY